MNRSDEAWKREVTSRVDDLVSGKVETIPHEDVLAHLARRRDPDWSPYPDCF
ncbi:MAG: addiction module protein [Nigerium sp.]|nr:addiction module protein [Nigerium sp.]